MLTTLTLSLSVGSAECWKYMEDRNLTILGFIHTHPTFSAFLSSIDLHMAFQIQKDIPGAIAIVVSTRDGTEPIFRITPEGMNVLKQCNEAQDKHHDHNTDITIYSECSVRLSIRKSVVIDMRSEECDRPSFNDSLPDIPYIDRLRRAENAARDSFEKGRLHQCDIQERSRTQGKAEKREGWCSIIQGD